MANSRVQFYGALALLALASACAADGVPALTLDDPAPSADATSFATGDWFGLRPKLEDKGFSFAGFVQLDYSKNLRGGKDTDGSATQYLLDLNATIDTQKAFGWAGGQIYADFESHDGPSASTKLAGDAQDLDSIDGSRFVQIAQLWYQQMALKDTLRMKVGKIDANSDFSVIEHGQDFLNNSMGITATVFPLPSYPAPAPGAEVFLTLWQHAYVGAGAFYSNSSNTFLNITGRPQDFQPAAGGMFFIGEAGYRWTIANALAGHAAVGGWDCNGRFPRFDGTVASGTGGMYWLLDQTLWKTDGGKGEPARELGAFAEGGWSEKTVSLVAQQVGAGLTLTAPLAFRPADLVGIGMTWADIGEAPDAGHGDEVGSEAFYKLQIKPWCSVKADVQYINHPGGTALGPALVTTVRLEVDF